MLVLGGHSWRVTHVDWKQRVAQVTPSGDEVVRGGPAQDSRSAMSCVKPCAMCSSALSCRRHFHGEPSKPSTSFARISNGSTARQRPLCGRKTIRWWTFGGLYANAAIASRLKADAIQTIRKLEPETLVPEVTTEAIEGFKFNDCLPPELAGRVLQLRMTDMDAVRRVLAEPAQLVAAM